MLMGIIFDSAKISCLIKALTHGRKRIVSVYLVVEYVITDINIEIAYTNIEKTFYMMMLNKILNQAD